MDRDPALCLRQSNGPWFCSAVTLWRVRDPLKASVADSDATRRSGVVECNGDGRHHTWLSDWMALDSAAALARLCHMVAGVWGVEWRESFSARDNIMAYA